MTDIPYEPLEHCVEILETVASDYRKALARIAELEAAIDKVLVAVSKSKMVPKPGCGVGGQSIDANIRGSDYLRVDAWPFEELSAARAAYTGADLLHPTTSEKSVNE